MKTIHKKDRGEANVVHVYPSPQEVGIKTPAHLIKTRYDAGFEHALKGEQLVRIEHLKLSFREGYRAGKLYLKALRKQKGILTFPMQGRIAFRVTG